MDSPRRWPDHSPRRPGKNIRPDVVDKDVDQSFDADVLAGNIIHRHLRLEAELNVFSRPDQSGIGKRARVPLLGPGNRRLKVEFDDGKHAIEGRSQADVLYGRLKVRNAVHERDSVTESCRIAFLVIAGPGEAVSWIIDGKGA